MPLFRKPKNVRGNLQTWDRFHIVQLLMSKELKVKYLLTWDDGDEFCMVEANEVNERVKYLEDAGVTDIALFVRVVRWDKDIKNIDTD